MFKIISDSPYKSKRSPITGEQVKSVQKASVVGSKKGNRVKKTSVKKKETQEQATPESNS